MAEAGSNFWLTIQPLTDLGDGGRVLVRQREARPSRFRSLDEEVDRLELREMLGGEPQAPIRQRQRWDRELVLAVKLEETT